MLKEEDALTIVNVNKADDGIYSCVVKTELDGVVVSARLKVMGKYTHAHTHTYTQQTFSLM